MSNPMTRRRGFCAKGKPDKAVMMGKKHLRCDHVETYYAALHGRHIALATIKPTALEAAEANARFNSTVDGHLPQFQIVEIKLGWNIEANAEMAV